MIKLLLIKKENCEACDIVKDNINEALENYNPIDVAFGVITVDSSDNIYMAEEFPTLIFMKDGFESTRIVGTHSAAYINKIINNLIEDK